MDFDQILKKVNGVHESNINKRKLNLIKENSIQSLIRRKLSKICNVPEDSISIKKVTVIEGSMIPTVNLEFSILDNSYVISCSEDKVESFIHSLPSKITDIDDPDIIITLNLLTYLISKEERKDLIKHIFKYTIS